ncbi:MAG: class I SAM-dependent methyltransferase [Beijerinckiaceae bacterium]|nr:class I SAM-dependent methyltransferase [Beijerinckiaceae bacterium]
MSVLLLPPHLHGFSNMLRSRTKLRWVLAAICILSTGVAAAQRRLDVPYVPTPMDVVERMLDLAEIKAQDFVIDLGSGDGRIPITAAKKYGARSLGIDLNPTRIAESQANLARENLGDKVEFREANLFQTDISKADILTMYLLPAINLQLKPRILAELRPGTRVVSHAFDMGRWVPDHQETVSSRKVMLWIVPAKVEGRWRVRDGSGTYTLTLEQQFQQVNGAAEIDGKKVAVTSGRLRGKEIELTFDLGPAGRRGLKGIVEGDTIRPAGQEDPFEAVRARSD